MVHLLTNKENLTFCFVIASFNNSANIEKNLNSVIEQSYPHWRVLYTNDCSTDRTHDMFHAILAKHPHLRDNFTYIRTNTQQGQMCNKYHMYKLVRDLEVVCLLDGDDWLLHSHVLQVLKDQYSRTDTKLCTSNYRTFFKNQIISYIPSSTFYQEHEIKQKTTRYNQTWLFKHLKTGYGILFKSIPRSYFQFNNTWLTCCTDCAEMHSACEFSNGKTSQIDQPLYVYNKDNSILYNNSYYNKKNAEERTHSLSYIRSLAACKYEWPFTYIINLAKDVERKNKMQIQLALMQNSNYTFIKAVDGDVCDSRLYDKYLEDHSVQDVRNLPNTKLYYNLTKQHITKKSLGLLSTVFIVLNKFVHSNLSHMVLFEDDVFSHKELPYYFFLHDNLLKDKDLVYLGCHHHPNKMYDEYVNNQDVFIDIRIVPFLIYGAYSMIMSKKLARFILSFGLESIVRLNLSWDLFLNYIREQDQHTFYLYFKELFIPNVCKYGGINPFRDQSFYTKGNINVDEYYTQWECEPEPKVKECEPEPKVNTPERGPTKVNTRLDTRIPPQNINLENRKKKYNRFSLQLP